MDERNQLALALAFKHAKGKTLKIQLLGIVPKMKEEEINTLIQTLATKKAEELGDAEKWAEEVKGQRWYVEDLVKFSGLSPKERLDYEYERAFPDVAEEDEMLTALEGMMDVEPETA